MRHGVIPRVAAQRKDPGHWLTFRQAQRPGQVRGGGVAAGQPRVAGQLDVTEGRTRNQPANEQVGTLQAAVEFQAGDMEVTVGQPDPCVVEGGARDVQRYRQVDLEGRLALARIRRRRCKQLEFDTVDSEPGNVYTPLQQRPEFDAQ